MILSDPVNLILERQSALELGGVSSATVADGGEVSGDFESSLREKLLEKASEKIMMLTEKLVSTTFFEPMLSQIREDPFKTDMFHGGFAEDAFGEQLDTIFADRIASRSTLPASQKITDSYMKWLEYQPIERIEEVSRLDEGMFG